MEREAYFSGGREIEIDGEEKYIEVKVEYPFVSDPAVFFGSKRIEITKKKPPAGKKVLIPLKYISPLGERETGLEAEVVITGNKAYVEIRDRDLEELRERVEGVY